MRLIKKAEWDTPCPLCQRSPEAHEQKEKMSSRGPVCGFHKAETIRIINSIDLTPFNKE